MTRFLVLVCSALFACGCNPVTYQSRQIPVQQLPANPLPATATYRVVTVANSPGANQLASGIKVPGLTPSTAENATVVIEASVGEATISNLMMATTERVRIVSSSNESGSYNVYKYTGTLATAQRLRITAHGKVLKDVDYPATSSLEYAKDPKTNGQFLDARMLEASFGHHRPGILQRVTIETVTALQKRANDAAADLFTTRIENIYLTVATAHADDPRFAQAASLFDQAVVGRSADAGGLSVRLQPAMELWGQIAAHPTGNDADDKTTATAAATLNQAVGFFLLDQLDAAERAAIAARSSGVDARPVDAIQRHISERRQRLDAQLKATP